MDLSLLLFNRKHCDFQMASTQVVYLHYKLRLTCRPKFDSSHFTSVCVCALSTGFTLASVLKNQSAFHQFLEKNLSLSNSTSSLLLSIPLSVREVSHCCHCTHI